MSQSTSPDVVCDLRALTDGQRKDQLITSIELIVRRGSGLVELPDGFEPQFEPAPDRLAELARWVERESVCCAWMDFAIIRSPSGPLRLRLSSSTPGAKDAIGAGLQAAAAPSRGVPVPSEMSAPTRTPDVGDYGRVAAR